MSNSNVNSNSKDLSRFYFYSSRNYKNLREMNHLLIFFVLNCWILSPDFPVNFENWNRNNVTLCFDEFFSQHFPRNSEILSHDDFTRNSNFVSLSKLNSNSASKIQNKQWRNGTTFLSSWRTNTQLLKRSWKFLNHSPCRIPTDWVDSMSSSVK